MVVIRSASTADAAQIAVVVRDSWFAAYDGIIAPAIIDRATCDIAAGHGTSRILAPVPSAARSAHDPGTLLRERWVRLAV